MIPTSRLLFPLLLCAASLPAQASTITEERVREAVGWLAADERAGRDTGSPELEQAAEWLAQRFAKAGLAQVQEGSWRHEFTMDGWRLDSREIQVTLTRTIGKDVETVVLKPDVDVRQATVADALSGDEECTVARHDDPVLQRLLTANSARRPVVCEVDTGHPRWVQAAGSHRVLGGRRQAARPLFLVRAGVLPKPAAEVDALWKITWSAPAAEKADVPQHNVLAMLPGTDKKDEFVVVSAHYDHIGIGRAVDGDAIHNGADDDATGTTAVVLLAEAMAKMPPPRRSVLFVCFAAEERGLLGSAGFCARPPVPLDKVVANLNLEMLGRPEAGKVGKAWITGADLSDFAAIAAAALPRGGVELVEFPMAAQLFAASDNFSFVKHGVVAHSLSAGSLHPDYHRPSDEVAKLDIAHMTVVVRACLEFTLELANRDQAPQWNDKGRQRLQKLQKPRTEPERK